MAELTSFSFTAKNLHDDAPDSLAMLTAFISERPRIVTVAKRPFQNIIDNTTKIWYNMRENTRQGFYMEGKTWVLDLEKASIQVADLE